MESRPHAIVNVPPHGGSHPSRSPPVAPPRSACLAVREIPKKGKEGVR